jgi:Zn-dependent membrane protease YugP
MFLIYFAAILLGPLLIQMYLKRTYAKHLKIQASSMLTGREVARKILDANGLYDVTVEEVHGKLTDHYDPRSRTVRLSSDNYHGNSVAGVAVSAHEVGHAIQHAENYAFLSFRHALFPIANIGSNLSFFFILIGIIFSAANLVLLGIIAMAAAVIFQLVTLPVEFNASNRAMDQVLSLNIIRNNEERETKKVLNAAALTYVAATVVAVAELLRFILMFVGMNNED